MWFEGDFRQIGMIDVEAFARAVDTLDEAAWAADTIRQTLYPAHARTQSIPLIYDPDLDRALPLRRPHHAAFETLLAPICASIAQRHPADARGYFVRILLSRLAAGAHIPSHRDAGTSLLACHRYHLALRTNPQVMFRVGDTERHMAAGEIWEINNARRHAVRNDGAAPRVHLILDYRLRGRKASA